MSLRARRAKQSHLQTESEIASLTEFTLSEVEGFARNDDEMLPNAKLLPSLLHRHFSGIILDVKTSKIPKELVETLV